ncbi:papilin [Rhea pennata]|uniref:papilin n=1 Tax=Rhea pennata TaxID=8795 RepID=UPI002E260343
MQKEKMKNMFLLLILAMMPPSALSGPRMKRQTDVWGAWGEWGECSRSCGGGVSFRQRRCYSQRTEGSSGCSGPTQSYRSCNIQSCPEGSRDFRAEQCAEFDGTEFQGKKYKWLPYYGAPNKCELNCIPKGENFYYRHKEAVVDGTTCEPGKRDICVEGVCQAVGCDNMLDSAKKEDKCLQCGGDGSTCYGVKGNFDVANLPKGYNQIFIIPMGATSIHIKEVMPSRNFLAVKNVRGEYYLNGHWTIGFSQALHIASTVMHYDRGSEGDLAPELLHARGPTTEPLVIELISQEPNPGIQYEYYLPVQEQSSGYSWSYSSWSECSSECGGGFQSRLVFCTIDNEIYPNYMCRNKPQPENNRTCGHQACPQTKRWKTGEWGSCSATCGGGTQTRSVYCVAYDGQSSQGVVDNAECMAFAQQPRSSQPCNVRQCATWNTGPWSECSASCGEGVQTRTVTCRMQQGSWAQDLACLMEPKPSTTQPCLRENCIQEIGWHVGDWGLCSKSCDSGIRTRQVICADGDSKFYSPETCKAIQPQKPATLGNCNMQPCYLPQQVPSMQDTMGYDVTRQSLLTRYNPNSPATDSGDERMLTGSSMVHSGSGNHHIQSTKDRGTNFLPVRWESQSRSSSSRQLSFPQDLVAGTVSQDCYRSPHGCCPDGHTPASGPLGRGCPFGTCQQSRYGCCPDGISSAQGPNNMGCPRYYSDVRVNRSQPTADSSTASQALSQQHSSGECRSSMYGCCFDNIASASGPQGEGCLNRPSYPFPVVCLLPSAHGPCTDWTTRWYFVAVVGKCNRFWYGGCHGNGNSFASEEECMRTCQDRAGVSPLQHQHADSRTRTGDAQGQQQPSLRESASNSPEGRAYGASHPTRDSHRGDSWRSDVLPEFLPRAGVLDSQRWGAQHVEGGGERRLGHLSQETTESERSGRQSGGGQQAPPREGEQQPKASPDSFPARTLHRAMLEEGRPSLVTAVVGQNIQLFCKTGTFPFSRVEWMKDGRPVSSDRHTYQSDSSLVISHIKLEDTGTYTCLISNGRMERRQIQLQIIEYQGAVLAESERGQVIHKENEQHRERSRGSKIVQGASSSVHQQFTYRLLMDKSEPAVVEAGVGERVRLPCTVEASPSLTIEWQKDGQPLSSPRHRQQSDGALVISRVSPEDMGFFTCVASNGRDQDQRQVLFRPLGELKITGLLPSITVAEGETAQLHCTVTGSNVNIRWSRNGVPMRADGHHIHLSRDGSLIISNVQEADEGSYTCSAYSSSNSVSASTEVKVRRSSRPSAAVNHVADLSRECVDQPHLANCDLILQAQLCSNEYYSSFCCSSCSRYQPQASPPHRHG